MTRSMDCTDIKVVLSGLVDDELDAQTRHLAERHVAECNDCRKLIDETESLNRLIVAEAETSGSPRAVSPDFVGTVLGRTVYADAPRHSTRGGWINWLGWMAAAAAVALAITIYALDRRPIGGAGSAGGPAVAKAQPPAQQPSIRSAAYRTEGRSWTYDGYLPSDAALGAAREQRTAVAVPTQGAPPLEPVDFRMPVLDERHLVALRTELAREPVISRDDADALDAAALLLDILASADSSSFADVEKIRRITEYDNLLADLALVRSRLAPQDRPALFAAEAILIRIVHGPISQVDLQDLRDNARRTDLAGQLTDISNRWFTTSTL